MAKRIVVVSKGIEKKEVADAACCPTAAQLRVSG